MRFRQPADQWRFALTRGLLRHLLGGYLGRPPGEITFRTGPAGKPFVVDDGGAGVRFNVSHAHDWALLALTRHREIGVDVERQRPMTDLDAIARRFFARAEAGTLDALDPAEREAAFYRIWTRKEAFVKATGKGIAWGLDRFTVSHEEGPDVTLRLLDDDAARPAWVIRSLPIEAGYAAAVAYEGPPCDVVMREWPLAP